MPATTQRVELSTDPVQGRHERLPRGHVVRGSHVGDLRVEGSESLEQRGTTRFEGVHRRDAPAKQHGPCDEAAEHREERHADLT